MPCNARLPALARALDASSRAHLLHFQVAEGGEHCLTTRLSQLAPSRSDQAPVSRRRPRGRGAIGRNRSEPLMWCNKGRRRRFTYLTPRIDA
ncbi:protein of unknown function [Pararobbsia alpina]